MSWPNLGVHTSNLFMKLDARRRTQAVRRAKKRL
jgi:DNA-binding NarL/FixJ family response regulator